MTAPFTTETAMAGQGSVDLWLRSSAADTDLEVTLTEVRPDGQEEYIQSGWLRASHRAARRGRVDRPGAVPHRHRGRRRPAARRRVRPGAGRPVPVRPRDPTRVEAAPQHRGAGRQPAVLDVRHHHTDRHADQRDRPLGRTALEGAAPRAAVEPDARTCRRPCRSARRCATSPAATTCRPACPPRWPPSSKATTCTCRGWRPDAADSPTATSSPTWPLVRPPRWRAT